jgi:predicted GIY-YIG superfamily endonuclease
MWYVYILRSINHPDQEYIGATADLKRRLSDHNAGKSAHTATRQTLQPEATGAAMEVTK